MKNFSLRATSPLAVLLASVALVASCSSDEKREYLLPERLCGAHIDAQLLEPLLPTGQEISQTDDLAPMGCAISIDSTRELSMLLYVTNSHRDPVEWATGTRTTEEFEHADIAGDSVLQWGDKTAGATASFPCAVEEGNPFVPEGGRYALFDLNIPGAMNIDDEDERMRSIEVFARNYVKGLKEMIGCDA